MEDDDSGGEEKQVEEEGGFDAGPQSCWRTGVDGDAHPQTASGEPLDPPSGQ
jgi:hypothetical protein